MAQREAVLSGSTPHSRGFTRRLPISKRCKRGDAAAHKLSAASTGKPFGKFCQDSVDWNHKSTRDERLFSKRLVKHKKNDAT